MTGPIDLNADVGESFGRWKFILQAAGASTSRIGFFSSKAKSMK